MFNQVEQTGSMLGVGQAWTTKTEGSVRVGIELAGRGVPGKRKGSVCREEKKARASARRPDKNPVQDVSLRENIQSPEGAQIVPPL